MLSAFYQPQNLFCIAVDEQSTAEFKVEIDLLSDCFPNVFVMVCLKVFGKKNRIIYWNVANFKDRLGII